MEEKRKVPELEIKPRRMRRVFCCTVAVGRTTGRRGRDGIVLPVSCFLLLFTGRTSGFRRIASGSVVRARHVATRDSLSLSIIRQASTVAGVAPQIPRLLLFCCYLQEAGDWTVDRTPSL
jgi:hypothetical protein